MTDRLKILVTVLVSSDLPRAIRCIKSCEHQTGHNLDYETYVVINTLNKEFEHDMVEYCNWVGKNYVITESDGTPSTGKNSVFEFFGKRTDFTHLVQIDGDDFLYPTFLRHIERHFTKYPNTDVIGILPCDSIYQNEGPEFHKLNNGLFAGLWGTNYSSWYNWIPFDTDTMFIDSNRGNLSRLMLFSRKIPNKFFYDKEQILGEDYKIHFDLLFAHQRDEIIYWFTSASDTWVRDTTSMGIQKQVSSDIVDGQHIIKKNEILHERLKNYVEKTNGVFRSGSGEIPIDFAPLYMGVEEKLLFLNSFL
jgi:hypothetical protein